ncbi:hypothetical protein KC968_00885 [Candidatus Saccharibacteria bacterium]|nr:hypothetical protein [Candidatus Saccharibacteria bacterium]
MAYIPKSIYSSNTPSSTGETLYAVPAGASVIMKNIVMTNTTSNDASVTIHLVGPGGSPLLSNRILSDFNIPAHGVSALDCSIVMLPTSFLYGINNTTGAIVLTISGVEIV